MIRYLTYEEQEDKVIVGDRLEKGVSGGPLDGLSNHIRPEGATRHRRQFVSPTHLPKKVWIAVATKILTISGQSGKTVDGKYVKTIHYYDTPQRWNTVHGPFTNKEEFKKKYDEVVWHYLEVEDNDKYDIDVDEIAGWSVDEFEKKREEYCKDMWTNQEHSDLLTMTIPVWYTRTSLENRKEWCRRDIQKHLDACNGLKRKQAEGLSEEEKQIVEELGGEKLTDELLEQVRKAHPDKTFNISSGCSDLVARGGHVDLLLQNGYVWSISPHW